MKERIEIVDLAKGVAILLVIFGHALTSVIDSLHLTASTSNASVWYAMKMIYAFHIISWCGMSNGGMKSLSVCPPWRSCPME